MRAAVKLLLSTALAALCVAGTATASDEAPRVELLHFWRAPAEQHALAALSGPVKAAGVEWRDYTSKGNFSGMKVEYARRIAIGSAPGILHWIMGGEMKRLASKGLIETVVDVDGFYRKNLIPEVYEAVRMEGGFSGVPVGIHTQNAIVYNKDILDKYNLSPPVSWDEYISYGPRLAKDGIYLINVSDEQWQIRLIFASILSTLVNVDDFRLFSRQGDAVTGLVESFEKTLSIIARIRPYSNSDFHDRDWQDVVKSVAQGESLSAMYGDYMAPLFADTSNIVCSIVPQSRFVIWGADAFIFPKVRDRRVRQGQLAFEAVSKTPDHLLEFAYRKGALPVLKGAPGRYFRPCLKHIYRQWRAANHKVLIGGDFWHRRFVAIGSFLKDEWRKRTIDPKSAAQRLIEILNVI